MDENGDASAFSGNGSRTRRSRSRGRRSSSKVSWMPRIPFLGKVSEDRKAIFASSSSARRQNQHQHQHQQPRNMMDLDRSRSHSHGYGHSHSQSQGPAPPPPKQLSFLTLAKATLLIKRRLRLDPDKKLFFLYEPGKQVASAVRIKNVSRSYVAFKFQTNAPKSCFMRPPGGILAPKESLLASVAKFVEPPENPQEKGFATRDKFKIVSLKVKQGTEYTPELFDERKEYVAVERILRVVFLDPQRPCKDAEKLKKRLAEAEALKQAQKKPQGQTNTEKSPTAPEGILDEWKERREKYLAKQQEEIADLS